jgi:urease gamma subunit
VRLQTNDLGAVVQDARNEDKSVMNRDPVVEGVMQLIRNVSMKSNCDGVGEHLTSPDLGLVSRIPRLLRTR